MAEQIILVAAAKHDLRLPIQPKQIRIHCVQHHDRRQPGRRSAHHHPTPTGSRSAPNWPPTPTFTSSTCDPAAPARWTLRRPPQTSHLTPHTAEASTDAATSRARDDLPNLSGFATATHHAVQQACRHLIHCAASAT
jgi:hypothetical protein